MGVFLFLSIVNAGSLRTDYILSNRGKVVEATITGEYGQKKKMVTCTYEVDGITYPALAQTPRDLEYSPDMAGNKVLLTYDPLDPKIHSYGDKPGTFLEEFSVGITFLCLACAFVAYVSIVAKRDFITEPLPNPR